jgi:8-oxo-dGTP pyrophosphatase MutT (NUDIX family)
MTKHIVSAKLFLVDGADNVLLLRRSGTHPRYPHEPDLPGGEVEAGEQMHEALARELLEETGMTINTTGACLLHAVTDEHDYGVYIQPILGLRIPETTPEITLSWEHEAYEWKPIAELALTDFEGAYQRGAQMILEYKLWQQL